VQQIDLNSQYAAELVQARVDVITTAGDDAIHTLQQATKTIPIVALTDDMLGAGFVNSLAHPDGNTTGANILTRELDGKRQDTLIEAVPGLRRMAVLINVYDETSASAQLEALQRAARARDIELLIHRIARGEEIAAAIDSAQASGARALNYSGVTAFLCSSARHYGARRCGTPATTIYDLPETAEEGGFAAYGPRLGEVLLKIWPEPVVSG
jgi:putative ABC transport system substrate-binding protein